MPIVAQNTIEKYGYIYVLLEPDENIIRYVGQTRDSVTRRLSGHLRAARIRTNNTHLLSWLRSCINKNTIPRLQTIEHVCIDKLDEREIFWISHLKSIGCNLVNSTVGGTGGPTRLGMKTPADVKAKQDAKKWGRKHSPEIIKKLGIIAKNRPMFICEICDKSIHGNSNYLQHTRKHQGLMSKGHHIRHHEQKKTILPSCTWCLLTPASESGRVVNTQQVDSTGGTGHGRQHRTN